jgi:hypothetical protein
LECGARSALILGLKGHGGWKSSSTSEDYIEDCIENKIQFARTNLHGDTNKEFSKPTTSMCNQEAKENTGHDNFDHANIAATPLMLFHCSLQGRPTTRAVLTMADNKFRLANFWHFKKVNASDHLLSL